MLTSTRTASYVACDRSVVRTSRRYASKHYHSLVAPWRDMVKALQEHAQLHGPFFVQIGESDHLKQIDEDYYPEETDMPDQCCFGWLWR